TTEARTTEATTPGAPPPVLGTWPRIYAVVAGTLFTLVGVFYYLTVTYR
ncbi:MAG: hypothetical protein ACI9OJ_004843, partial [Myxococcota bacterium]